MDRFIADMPALFVKATSVADIRAAKAAGKVGHHLQFPGHDPARGRRRPGRRRSRRSGFGCSSSPTTSATSPATAASSDANAGLSDFGRQVIAEIERNRLLLDLSHSGQRTHGRGHRRGEERRPQSPIAAAATSSTCRATQYDRRASRSGRQGRRVRDLSDAVPAGAGAARARGPASATSSMR